MICIIVTNKVGQDYLRITLASATVTEKEVTELGFSVPTSDCVRLHKLLLALEWRKFCGLKTPCRNSYRKTTGNPSLYI